MAGIAADDVHSDCTEIHVRGDNTAGAIRVVKAIKRIDGSDVYDEGISYKVWKISEI